MRENFKCNKNGAIICNIFCDKKVCRKLPEILHRNNGVQDEALRLFSSDAFFLHTFTYVVETLCPRVVHACCHFLNSCFLKLERKYVSCRECHELVRLSSLSTIKKNTAWFCVASSRQVPLQSFVLYSAWWTRQTHKALGTRLHGGIMEFQHGYARW